MAGLNLYVPGLILGAGSEIRGTGSETRQDPAERNPWTVHTDKSKFVIIYQSETNNEINLSLSTCSYCNRIFSQPPTSCTDAPRI